ncbi:MAG: PA14 domain-containing protein [Arenibacterium sp.]
MKRFASLMVGAVLTLWVGALWAAPLPLNPANPQPGSVKSGLSVRYAYPTEDIKTLADASAALNAKSVSGPPLTGLDYRDTSEGQITLTSKRAENVAARIKGYVKFDAPGTYEIEFMVNDGIRARIGGQVVGFFDGRQPCDTTRIVEVSVPQAGWYPVDVLYFQRLGTSCLHMRWGKAGERRTWTPNSAFGR